MKKKPFIAVTAGHVDHGKSSLVEALSGINPDRLPEEKRRGMTIELGFAQFYLPIKHTNKLLQIGLIDVPGHENFVKTMVSGMGNVDLAILVVSATEGWMPQTEEHMQILEYVGVRARIIALTKCDLLSDLNQAIAELRAKVTGTSFANTPIVPISVLQMTGLEELRQELTKQLLKLSQAKDNCLPRLSVDRIFSISGAGTVITGTITGGFFKQNQRVQIWPSGISARIRAMENFNDNVKWAGPATRVGMNLSVNRTENHNIQRGNIVAESGDTLNSKQFDAFLVRNNRQRDLLIRHGSKVRIHHGTANLPATVYLEPSYSKDGLTKGTQAFARLKLSEKRPFLISDHFILRDWSQKNTLAGGIVLVPSPQKKLNHKSQIILLNRLAKDPRDAKLIIQAFTESYGMINLEDLSLMMPVSFQKIEQHVLDLAEDRRLLFFQKIAVEPRWFAKQVTNTKHFINEKLKNAPERTGVAITTLAELISAKEILTAVVTELEKDGYSKRGSLIQPTHYSPSLPSNLERVATTMRVTLNRRPLLPPSRSELIAEPGGTTVLQYLVNTGEAVLLDDKTVLSVSAYRKARKKVVEFLLREQKATTSTLRHILGTNRRIIVPLLENLDHRGVTLRIGNERTLSAQSRSTNSTSEKFGS